MRYMLMMHAPRGNRRLQVNSWSPDDLKAHIGFMHHAQQGAHRGRRAGGRRGARAAGRGKLVRAGKNGGPPVTDGPFPEIEGIPRRLLDRRRRHARSARTRSPRERRRRPDPAARR